MQHYKQLTPHNFEYLNKAHLTILLDYPFDEQSLIGIKLSPKCLRPRRFSSKGLISFISVGHQLNTTPIPFTHLEQTFNYLTHSRRAANCGPINFFGVWLWTAYGAYDGGQAPTYYPEMKRATE